MVISDNQNLYFKIQCKITTNKIIVHFHDISNTTNDSHNKLNAEIHEEVYTS